MFLRTTLLLGIASAAALLSAGCKKEVQRVAPQPPKVTVARPVVRDTTNYLEFTGTVKAVESIDIRARVEGFLESIHFEDGADIQSGELLFSIDPKPFQAVLDESKAALQLAEANVTSAEANRRRAIALAENRQVQYERAVQAGRSGAVTASEIDDLRTMRDSAVADVEVAKAAIASATAEVAAKQAAVQQATINLGYTKVVSPIRGRLGEKLVDVGNLVGGVQKTLLAHVVQLDPIHAYFDIDERTYLKLLDERGGSRQQDAKEKVPVFLARQNDKEFRFPGEIDFLDNVIDPNTGTIIARGTFPNQELTLTPGMFVRLRIPQQAQPNTVLVEERAIGTDMSGKFVLVLDKGQSNVVQLRRVELGRSDDNLRVVRLGLDPEDEYIVDGTQRARPGLAVQPERAGSEQ